jgi:V8-like Glu-specific endopeptidase
LTNNSVKDKHTFDPDRDVLLNTSDYVVFIVIEFKTGRGYATGFHIDERHILSAGHNFYDNTNRIDSIKSIRSTVAGLPNVDFDKLFNRRLSTHNLKIVNNLYDPHNPKREHDIALLECLNGVNGPMGIPLSPALPPVTAVVDVIGYPAFTADVPYLVAKGYQLIWPELWRESKLFCQASR